MSPAEEEGGLPEQVLYHPDLAAPRLTLDPDESRHAIKSLRLRSGDKVVVADGKGSWGLGRITGIGKKRVEVTVSRVEARPRWPRRELWLGMGVLKSQRMDLVLEKASELGVSRFTPLLMQRCVARPGRGGAKDERWHRLALESMKQSRRSHLMGVAGPQELPDFLDRLPEEREVWVADPEGSPPPEPGGAGPLVLVVGPEGGLAPEELERLRACGSKAISLGGNRLRAETAALALTVTALQRLGSFDVGYR